MTIVHEPLPTLSDRAPLATVRRGLRFREGVTAICDAESRGLLELRFEGEPVLRVRGMNESVAERITALDGIPQPAPPLSAADAATFAKIVSAMGRCLAEGVWEDDRLVAEVQSLRPGVSIDPVELTDSDRVRLSKFAYVHRRDADLHVESPIGGARLVIHDLRVLDVVGRLSFASDVGALTGTPEQPGADHRLRPDAAHAVIELLASIGAVDVGRPGADVEFASDSNLLRQWDFHDLLFHTRSRFGRTDEAFGGVFPYRGEFDPLPAIRPPHTGSDHALPTPDLDQVLDRDPALVTVMEGRHSVRHYGEQPMTQAQLSEFLFRVARVRGTYGPMPEAGMPYPASSRPYPCGGAGYELELYVTVRRCEGLEPGVYHYRADTHRLTLLGTPPALRQQLLDAASLSAGGDVHPDVLITVTARFQRISWKYRSIAYAVTLKHTGVLYQTMYLVATAMGLGACGLGSGNSDLSAQAFGLDYLEESSVGEFILGSLPSPLAGAPLPGGNPIGKIGADATWQARVSPDWYARSHEQLRGGLR